MVLVDEEGHGHPDAGDEGGPEDEGGLEAIVWFNVCLSMLMLNSCCNRYHVFCCNLSLSLSLFIYIYIYIYT